MTAKTDDAGKAVTYTYTREGKLKTRTWACKVGEQIDRLFAVWRSECMAAGFDMARAERKLRIARQLLDHSNRAGGYGVVLEPQPEDDLERFISGISEAFRNARPDPAIQDEFIGKIQRTIPGYFQRKAASRPAEPGSKRDLLEKAIGSAFRRTSVLRRTIPETRPATPASAPSTQPATQPTATMPARP